MPPAVLWRSSSKMRPQAQSRLVNTDCFCAEQILRWQLNTWSVSIKVATKGMQPDVKGCCNSLS